MNIKSLSKSLRDNTVALITSETNRLYFTEFSASDGFLIVGKTGAKFITDSRYIEAALKEAKDCEVELQKTGLSFDEQLKDIIKSFDAKEVLIEASRLSVSDASYYEEKLSDFILVKSNELDEIIDKIRKIKAAEEIKKIKRAQEIAEGAFKKILPLVKVGVMERDIAVALDYEMRKLGALGVSFETIVVAGENSSKPHGVPSDNKIKNGDFVTFDFGAIYEGYHSDTTRTVSVGTPTSEMANVYDIVLSAQKAGVKALKPGLPCREADKVCRDIIKDAGYGEFFGHGTGHGVGVEIHEKPNLSPRTPEDILLEVGNVVTVEPGIYLPGKFGVRIEDMLQITEDGAYNFVTLPKELITL